MLHTQEFIDAMNFFERNARELVSMGAQGLSREPKENWPNKFYYSDGNVNNAFKMFLFGYSAGRAVYLH